METSSETYTNETYTTTSTNSEISDTLECTLLNLITENGPIHTEEQVRSFCTSLKRIKLIAKILRIKGAHRCSEKDKHYFLSKLLEKVVNEGAYIDINLIQNQIKDGVNVSIELKMLLDDVETIEEVDTKITSIRHLRKYLKRYESLFTEEDRLFIKFELNKSTLEYGKELLKKYMTMDT